MHVVPIGRHRMVLGPGSSDGPRGRWACEEGTKRRSTGLIGTIHQHGRGRRRGTVRSRGLIATGASVDDIVNRPVHVCVLGGRRRNFGRALGRSAELENNQYPYQAVPEGRGAPTKQNFWISSLYSADWRPGFSEDKASGRVPGTGATRAVLSK